MSENDKYIRHYSKRHFHEQNVCTEQQLSPNLCVQVQISVDSIYDFIVHHTENNWCGESLTSWRDLGMWSWEGLLVSPYQIFHPSHRGKTQALVHAVSSGLVLPKFKHSYINRNRNIPALIQGELSGGLVLQSKIYINVNDESSTQDISLLSFLRSHLQSKLWRQLLFY